MTLVASVEGGWAERAPPLIGRAGELTALVNLLLRPDLRVVTVTGRRGLGKTVLARAAASQVADDGRFAVRMVRSEAFGHGAPGRLVGFLAGETRWPESGWRHSRGNRRTLLVVDGVDSNGDAQAAVREALEREDSLLVLATGVLPLSTAGEWVFPLKPLPFPTTNGDDPVTAGASPAVRLFCARAAEIRKGFRLTASNAGVISALCCELEGVPLAIELAAARLATMSPDAILTRCRMALAPGPGQSVSTAAGRVSAEIGVLGWSIGLLTPRQRVLLGLSSVFAGSFDWAALNAVVGPSIGAQYGEGAEVEMAHDMKALVAVGLMSDRVPEGVDWDTRYSTAPSVRRLAPLLVEKGHLLTAVGRRHTDYYRGQARRIAEQQGGFGGASLARRLVVDQSEFLAALAQVTASGDALAALGFAVDLTDLWVGAATQSSGLAVVDGLVSRAKAQTGGRLPAELETRAILAVTELALWGPGADMGSTAQGRLQRAEELAVEAGRLDLVWQARHLRIQLLVMGGAYAAALEGISTALISGNTDSYWRMRLLLWRSMALGRSNEREEALEAGVQARDLARGAGDEHQLLLACHVLCGIPGARDDPRAAVPAPEELLDRARRLGDRYAEGHIVTGVIFDQLVHGNVPGAAQHVIEALDLAHRSEAWYVEELAIVELVMVACLAGRHEWAASLHGSLDANLSSISLRFPERALKEYQVLLEVAEEAMGAAAFKRACAASADRSWSTTVKEARRIAARLSSRTPRGPGGSDGPASAIASVLPPRELEVLHLMASGCSNKEIAALLHLSPKTVMHYTTRIYRHLGVRSRAEAVSSAWRLGLLPPG